MIVYVIVEEHFHEGDFGFAEMFASEIKGVYSNEEQVKKILGFSEEYARVEDKYPFKRAYYQQLEVQ